MNILILSYACEPGAGSEYEVGWKVPTVMAHLHPEMNVYVVTRSTSQDSVLSGKVAELGNLHYLFYKIPSWMTYPDERRSRWGEQINYALWQLMVRNQAKKWCEEYEIDVVHHLTFNQYRTPSPGYWVERPFVLGPVGGAECISPVFYQDLEMSTLRKEKFRVKGYDRKIFKWFLTRNNAEKVILCSSRENLHRLSPYRGNATIMQIPAIGISPDDFDVRDTNPSDKTFRMICAGKAWDWKGLFFVLRSMSVAFFDKPDWNLKLVGIRFEEEQKRVIRWIEELHLENNVELIPYINREDLLRIEADCNLSVYPAFRDSGSMAVLEACALGCTSICLDAGGQDVFPDGIVLKVPIGKTYEDCIESFAKKLNWAYENPEKLDSIGKKARQWAFEEMSWEKKVEEFRKIYEKVKGYGD